MDFNFNNTYTTLPAELFSPSLPAAVSKPQLLVWNNKLARELGLNADNTGDLASVFSGNTSIPGSACIAQAYGGHQFGYFNKLGDGRAILLGEQITPSGKRYDLQFKGSGITPYSRRGDGKATLVSMLREYIISEAMHGLGIPTTRSLAVVATGEKVYREQVQPGAVLTRVAASHIRVGTFEYAAQFCSTETLMALTNYVIKRHYPEIAEEKIPALALLEKVMYKQLDLIVNWMRVGFIHGVMNTDNMSISGETIDYGPCAFMNTYKPETVFSSIDTGGRYAFGNQAAIAAWNLSRLAEALLPLIDTNTDQAIQLATDLLYNFQPEFDKKYLQMMAAKIGISDATENNRTLINELMNWMYNHNADYTNTFLKLMYPDKINDLVYNNSGFVNWQQKWKQRITNTDAALNCMQANNPIYIPRNQKVEEILEQTQQTGQTDNLYKWVELLSHPYNSTDFQSEFMLCPDILDEQDYKTYCGT